MSIDTSTEAERLALRSAAVLMEKATQPFAQDARLSDAQVAALDPLLESVSSAMFEAGVDTGGGSAAQLREDLASVDGTDLIGAPGAGTLYDALSMVSVAQFGAMGSGVESTTLTSACAQAVAQGHKRVFIPFATFTVAAGTDCAGCELFGVDTELVGRLENHAGLHNILVRGQNQSDKTTAPAPRVDSSNKLLWRFDANKDYVVVEKRSAGYLFLVFVKDSTTTNDSLALTNTEATRRRLGAVENLVWAGVYKKTASLESGVWAAAQVTQPAAPFPVYTSGRALDSRFTTVNGAYTEFVVKPRNGFVQFALLTGTGSTASASVTINGAAAGTIAPVATVGNTIKTFSVYALGVSDTDDCTVRLTHTGSAGTRLQVIGFNFYELRDWRGQVHDAFAYFRNTAFADYLTQSSANDAVIMEYLTGKYGISYHGGETSIVSDWKSAGAVVSPAIDGYVVTTDLKLENSADVSWAGVNPAAGSINIKATWYPSVAGVSHSAQITGDVVVKEIYSHMFGAVESFTDVLSPVRYDLVGMPSGTRNVLGRTSQIVVRNPTTGQQIISDLTVFNREQNQYGGAHIWNVTGSYNKQYYGPCLGGKMRIRNMAVSSVFTFL